MKAFIALLLLFVSHGARAEVAIGVNTHQAWGESIEILKDMGATWVRVSQPWAEIETRAGVYDFAFTDLMLNDLKARGMKVLFILAYPPPFWSSNGQQNGLPDQGAWTRYVDAVTRRYAGSVDAWEIWNEPNLGQFFKGTVWQYIDVVLKPASPIIRRNAPGALIAAPGITHILEAWPDFWMTQLRWFDVLDTFDVVAYHLYANSNVAKFKERMSKSEFLAPSVRRVMEVSGLAGKPFWLTEYGCDVDENVGGEEAQGDCLVGMAQVMKDLPWVSGWFTYAMNDGTWALLRQDGTERPAVAKLKALYASWR
jgi:polysaccharide biosynthesis protein PslG